MAIKRWLRTVVIVGGLFVAGFVLGVVTYEEDPGTDRVPAQRSQVRKNLAWIWLPMGLALRRLRPLEPLWKRRVCSPVGAEMAAIDLPRQC